MRLGWREWLLVTVGRDVGEMWPSVMSLMKHRLERKAADSPATCRSSHKDYNTLRAQIFPIKNACYSVTEFIYIFYFQLPLLPLETPSPQAMAINHEWNPFWKTDSRDPEAWSALMVNLPLSWLQELLFTCEHMCSHVYLSFPNYKHDALM